MLLSPFTMLDYVCLHVATSIHLLSLLFPEYPLACLLQRLMIYDDHDTTQLL